MRRILCVRPRKDQPSCTYRKHQQRAGAFELLSSELHRRARLAQRFERELVGVSGRSYLQIEIFGEARVAVRN